MRPDFSLNRLLPVYLSLALLIPLSPNSHAQQSDPSAKKGFAPTFSSGMSLYQRGQYKEALSHFNHCAGSDKPACDSMAGAILLKGKGGIQSDAKAAFEKVESSAWAGLPAAMFNLAELHARGVGTRKDERLAFEWFERAAKKGDVQAMLKTSRYYEQGRGIAQADESMALHWLRRATATGSELAYAYMAEIYETGRLGYEQSDEMAFLQYQKAARMRHTDSTVKAVYLSTRLPEFAIAQAQRVAAYTEAAEQGSVLALHYLGDEFKETDRIQAYVFYGLAAESGHLLSKKHQDIHAQTMTAYELAAARRILAKESAYQRR